MKQKKKMSLLAKQSAAGWIFLTPAALLIAVMAFWPMIQAFIMSLQTGSSANMQWSEPIFNNYVPDHSGADHADSCNLAGAASE